MKKSELKQIINEVIQELRSDPLQTKWGTKKDFIILKKDYKNKGIGIDYKAGDKVPVTMVGDKAIVKVGYGLDIEIPQEYIKTRVTDQEVLPDNLRRRIQKALECLDKLIDDKKSYYEEAFPKDEVQKVAKQIAEKLKIFVSSKAPIRKGKYPIVPDTTKKPISELAFETSRVDLNSLRWAVVAPDGRVQAAFESEPEARFYQRGRGHTQNSKVVKL